MASESPSETFLQMLAGLKANDEDANRKIYERYIKSVIRLASNKLDPRLRGRVDPESVAQSAMMSLFDGIRSDTLQFQGWASLYCFLATVTKRKALNQNRYHDRAIRNDEKDPLGNERQPTVTFEDHLAKNPEAGPAEMAEINDLVEVALGRLDQSSRKSIELFLSNASKVETAKELGVSIRTVERRIEDFQTIFDRVAGE